MPISVSCEVNGLVPAPVSKAKAASALAVRSGKRRAASTTGRCVGNKASCSDVAESVTTVSGTDVEPCDQEYEGGLDALDRREEPCRRSARLA